MLLFCVGLVRGGRWPTFTNPTQNNNINNSLI
jgi:hypothetical protein